MRATYCSYSGELPGRATKFAKAMSAAEPRHYPSTHLQVSPICIPELELLGMNIVEATNAYEAWLAAAIPAPLNQADLDYKHRKMADADNPFPFLRGTYYRWAQRFADTVGDLAAAPQVLSIGDLHVENFGTWRDADGRLCWGVNDFDEADDLPYTNDLIRLAVSVRLAKKAGGLDIGLGESCATILDGYLKCLTASGQPFVLEEHNPVLRKVAMSAEREPSQFWRKATKLLDDPEPKLPEDARVALIGCLPVAGLKFQVRARTRVGMGSLGRPRFIALAEWAGGWIAREAKAIAPPATAFATGRAISPQMTEAVARAVRSPDPFYRPLDKWVVRRLAPRCSRIELGEIAKADAQQVLNAMGAETANVHLGTASAGAAILADLAGRPADWLDAATKAMSGLVERDWQEWRASIPNT
jgi:Uncharacterized protein conserved in bacteria (DUF2252)